ncbi:MAG: hypothetical protein WAR22_07805, partial [Desulfomonilia bacterium]
KCMCIVKGIFLKKLVTSAHDHVMIMVWQRYAHGISGMIGRTGGRRTSPSSAYRAALVKPFKG